MSASGGARPSLSSRGIECAVSAGDGKVRLASSRAGSTGSARNEVRTYDLEASAPAKESGVRP